MGKNFSNQMIKFLLNCLIVGYHDFHCLKKKKNYHPKLKGEVNNLLLRVLRRLSPRASIIVAVYSTHSTSADYYSNSLRSNEVI